MPLYGPGVALPGVSEVICAGHSLTNGTLLPDLQFRLAAKLGGEVGSSQELNYSIPGAAAASPDSGGTAGGATSTCFPGGYATILQSLKRYGSLFPYEAFADVVLLQYGINDMVNVAQSGTRGGNTGTPSTQGKNAYIHAMRTIISRFRAGVVFEESDASVTYASVDGGTWANQANPAQVAGVRGTGAMSSGSGYQKLTGTAVQKNGSVITIKIPGDYPGSAVCPLHVGFVADPLLTTGTITSGGTSIAVKTLTLDSASVCDTVNTPAMPNGLVLRFTGSDIPANTNGATRTLTLTVSNTSAAGEVRFDYWGIESQTPPIICVLDIAKLNPVGAFGSMGAVANTDIATWNTALTSLVAEFAGAGGSGGSDNTVQLIGSDAIIGGSGRDPNVPPTVTDNPLSAVATTVNVTSSTGLVSPVMIDTEIIEFTGTTGTSLTGCVRGAYTVAAGSHGSGSAVRNINRNAIQYHAVDGLHWTARAQDVIAAQAFRQIRPFLPDVTQNARRCGAGRLDSRVAVRVGSASSASSTLSDQILQKSSFVPIIFDTQDYDSANMHNPNTGTPGTAYTRLTANTDGMYQYSGYVQFDSGKRAGTGLALGGRRAILVRKNGSEILRSNYVDVDLTEYGVFWPTQISVAGNDLLRNGDYIELLGFWNEQRSATYLTTKATTVATTALTTVSPLNGGTFTVASGAALTAGDYFRIDDEVFFCRTISTNTITVDRGQFGTIVAAHAIGAAVYVGFGTPSGGSTLSAGITQAATSVPVAAGTWVQNNDWVRVDDEMMLVTAGSGTTTLTVTRAQGNSFAPAAGHASGAAIYAGVSVRAAKASLTRLQAA